MPTSYSDIYRRAIFRFKDDRFVCMNDADIDEVLRAFLNSALSDFEPLCQIDLSDRDEDAAQFNQELDNECMEILSAGIAYYWLSAQLFNKELLQNRLSTKDYTYFSPANLLRESQTMRNEARKEYRDLITKYTYRHGDIAGINAT